MVRLIKRRHVFYYGLKEVLSSHKGYQWPRFPVTLMGAHSNVGWTIMHQYKELPVTGRFYVLFNCNIRACGPRP